MSDPKPYHHGHLREVLLEASMGLIRETGMHGFTLREVARRAGVSHAAPYRHFQVRADLLAALAEDGFNRLTADMCAAAARSRAPFKRLQNAGLAYVEFAQDKPEHFLVMFSLELDDDAHPAAKAASERCYQQLLGLVSACFSSPGSFSPKTAARLAWIQVHGIAELALRGKLGLKTRKELRSFTNLATEIFGRGSGLASGN
jgi:AcrR family transcriptional regulator